MATSDLNLVFPEAVHMDPSSLVVLHMHQWCVKYKQLFFVDKRSCSKHSWSKISCVFRNLKAVQSTTSAFILQKVLKQPTENLWVRLAQAEISWWRLELSDKKKTHTQKLRLCKQTLKFLKWAGGKLVLGLTLELAESPRLRNIWAEWEMIRGK